MTSRILRKWLGVVAVALLALPFASTPARAAYSQAELDQMLAPIALYPDPLLSQILMAATYPEDIAEAARWSADHRSVEGDVAVQMVQDFDWDPSVKSLVAFPTVLERMGQSPDWTRSLGDAFLAQEPQVMETVQVLRQRAQAAGHLVSDDKVRILDEPQAIAIVPANPQAIYVPYYDPLVVYGTWWWPAYPPFAWDPWPGYAYPYFSSAFWWGAPIGLSVGFFFGAIDWPRRHVRIAHTDNYYVRRWIERRHLSGTTSTGRWRPDYWQRRDFSRRGPVTQSQTVAPIPQQRQLSGPTRQRQSSRIVPHQQAPRPDSQRRFSGVVPHQQAPRPDSQRQFPGVVPHQQAPRPDSQRQFSGVVPHQQAPRPDSQRQFSRPPTAAPRMHTPPAAARADRAPAANDRSHDRPGRRER